MKPLVKLVARLGMGVALVCGKLAIAGNQCPTVVMARQHRAIKDVQRLRHAVIAQVSDVEDHPQLIEDAQQLDAGGAERPGYTGAVGVM